MDKTCKMAARQVFDVFDLNSWIQGFESVVILSIGEEKANVGMEYANFLSQQEIKLGNFLQYLA